jgi:hypothetical protein
MSKIKIPAAIKAAKKQPNTDRLKDWALETADKAIKFAAGTFFLATSYGFVESWLKAHQTNTQLPTAGGIMVVSIALYLFCRQR